MIPEQLKSDQNDTCVFRHACRFNENVGCAPFHRHCERCGWNLKVAQARLEKFCKERGIPVPLPPREE